MKTITVAEDAARKDTAKNLLREIDREDLVKLLIAYGIEPVLVEGDATKVVLWFIATEIESFENRYLTNKADMVVPVLRIAHANEYWRNLLTLWKSKLKQAYSAE
jgi:hypothetical protein